MVEWRERSERERDREGSPSQKKKSHFTAAAEFSREAEEEGGREGGGSSVGCLCKVREKRERVREDLVRKRGKDGSAQCSQCSQRSHQSV